MLSLNTPGWCRLVKTRDSYALTGWHAICILVGWTKFLELGSSNTGVGREAFAAQDPRWMRDTRYETPKCASRAQGGLAATIDSRRDSGIPACSCEQRRNQSRSGCHFHNARVPDAAGFFMLTRIIHQLVGWDKETAIWWAGTCELTFHFDYKVLWVRSPFPPAHHGLTHAGPTLRNDSKITTVFPVPLTLPSPQRGEGSGEVIFEPFLSE